MRERKDLWVRVRRLKEKENRRGGIYVVAVGQAWVPSCLGLTLSLIRKGSCKALMSSLNLYFPAYRILPEDLARRQQLLAVIWRG